MSYRFFGKCLATVTILGLYGSVAWGQGPRGAHGGIQGRSGQSQSMGQRSVNGGGTNAQNGQMQNGGMMPGMMGTIVNGDSSTGQLVIQSPQSNANVVVQVTSNTQITTGIMAAVSDLKVGDIVMVGGRGGGRGNGGGQNDSGGNTATVAGQGQRAMPPQGNGFQRGNGGNSGFHRGGMNGNGQSGMAANGNSQNGNGGMGAPLTGRVTALNPLTIAADNGNTVTVNLPANAPVMRLISLTFNDLTLGDRVAVTGQNNGNGIVTATAIWVNRGAVQMGESSNLQQNGMTRGVQGQTGASNPNGRFPQGRRGGPRPGGH